MNALARGQRRPTGNAAQVVALSDRQQEAYDFIISYFANAGGPPTLRVIAEAMDLNTDQAARVHVNALIRKGYLRKVAGRSCALPEPGKEEQPSGLAEVLAEIKALRTEVARLALQLSATAPDQGKRTLSPEDAARASSLTRSAVYEAIARGDLASFKAGKRRLILSSELDAWLRRMAKSGAR